MVLLQGGISAIRRIWKYVSIIGTVVVVSPFMTQHVRAFQNEYTIHSDAEGFGLSITDVTTGITNLRTLFIHEEHSVTVKGIEWRTITPSDNNNSNNNNNNTTMQPTNRPEEELLWWSTVVDGTVVATGNISLNDHGRLLPTHFDAGTFTVSSNRKHYVQVILQLNNGNVNDDDPTSKFIVSDTYVAYRPGVSIIPMIFVLVMAMSTHMVEVSLFSCIFVGACIVAGNVWDGFKDSLAVYLVGAMYDKDHVFVILFTLFLSGLVGMMEKSGGMIGFTKFVSRLAKTQRRGQYSVFITSCMIFFDDYANIMLTGETMKPLTDLLMVSREKLAFIVDATAGPISSLSPISSWVEIGLIIKEVNKLKVKFGADHLTITTSGLGTFLQSLKYCYYPIFMIFLLFCIIGFQRDFGPMLIAERKVFISQRTDGGNGKGKQVTSTTEQKVNQPRADAPYYAFNMLIPVVVLVVLIFYLLANAGEGNDATTGQSFWDKIEGGNSFLALLWGTFATSLITLILYLVQWYKPDGSLGFPNYKTFRKHFFMKENLSHRRLDEDEHCEDDNDESLCHDVKPLLSLPVAVDSFMHGMSRIFPALVVLNLAWAVGSIMVDIGADRLFSRWIVHGLDPNILPTLSFVITFLLSLATGTSWGAMTILFPLLLVPTYEASDGNATIFYSTVAGILSGGVAGDHVSPISDTIALCALACDCQILRHITTQTPYVMVVLLVSILVGTLPIGSEVWPNFLSILVGCLLVILFTYFVCVPVALTTGRYDIITELGLRFFPNSELLELRENTKKFHLNGEIEEKDDMFTENTDQQSQVSDDLA